MGLTSIFLSTFVAMFVIVDPLGTSAVFAAMTAKLPRDTARGIALKAPLIATGLLCIFALGGEMLLRHTGISLPAFRIAGGLLLFITAFRMIFGSHDAVQINSPHSAYADRSAIAIFPLAIPLLAGPGCMTAALLNMSTKISIPEKLAVLAAIASVEAIALICMFGAGGIVRMLGTGGSSLLARLMGILLAAMAVQFIADGSFAMLGHFLASAVPGTI